MLEIKLLVEGEGEGEERNSLENNASKLRQNKKEAVKQERKHAEINKVRLISVKISDLCYVFKKRRVLVFQSKTSKSLFN